MATDYPYVRPDLLDRPNTYYYSSYGGQQFLHAWKSQREAVLAALPVPATTMPSAELRPVVSGDTAALIENGLFGLCNQPEQDGTEIAKRLLARFESSRKLYRAYDENIRIIDRGVCRDGALYLRLAEMFEVGCADGGDTRYINAFLKCNDILCAIYQDLDAPAQARLARLLLREQRILSGLAERLGVGL